MWLDDLVKVLEAAQVGQYETNIFCSSRAVIPTGAGPYLSLRETGGTAPERIQNQTAPAKRKPSAQLMVTAKDYTLARAMIEDAYLALTSVHNHTVLTMFFLEITPLQEPMDLGLDDAGRARVAFNVLASMRQA